MLFAPMISRLRHQVVAHAGAEGHQVVREEASDASSSASELVIIVMSISFRLIDRFRNVMVPSSAACLSRGRGRFSPGREGWELIFEPRPALAASTVDVEAHLVVIDPEVHQLRHAEPDRPSSPTIRIGQSSTRWASSPIRPPSAALRNTMWHWRRS